MKISSVLSLLFFLSILSILPFVWVGYAAHDLQFHLSSWMEIRDTWQSGQLWPGWDQLTNFTLGDAHFCFYPPMSFLLGAGLSTILPLRIVPGAFVMLLVFVSGITMYGASREFVAEEDRIKAAILYMLSPYLLTTAIARFAASELMVEAWLPLICLLYFRTVWHKDMRSLPYLGGLLGLSWMTNIPASIVLCYGLGIVAVVTAIRRRLWQPVFRFMLAEAIAGLLAAFYLLPALAEQKWITPSGLYKFGIREFLLFAPISTLHYVLFSFSCSGMACVGIVLVALCTWSRGRHCPNNQAAETWWAIALVSFGFQLPFTLFLWKHLPELLAVQFSFRFLLLLGVVLPFALLGKGTPRSLRLPSYAILALLSCLPVLVVVRVQRPWHVYPSFSSLMSQWAQHGKRGAPEYLPPGVTRLEVPPDIPAAVVVGGTSASHCSVLPQMKGLWLAAVQTQSEGPCNLRLRKYFNPYWRAVDEEGVLLPVGRDSSGLLSVSVPPGNHVVRLEFNVKSPLRTASAVLSALSALLLGGTMFCLSRNRIRQKDACLAVAS